MTKAERFRAFLDSVTLKTENLSQPILDECRGEYEEAKPHNTGEVTLTPSRRFLRTNTEGESPISTIKFNDLFGIRKK